MHVIRARRAGAVCQDASPFIAVLIMSETHNGPPIELYMGPLDGRELNDPAYPSDYLVGLEDAFVWEDDAGNLYDGAHYRIAGVRFDSSQPSERIRDAKYVRYVFVQYLTGGPFNG